MNKISLSRRRGAVASRTVRLAAAVMAGSVVLSGCAGGGSGSGSSGDTITVGLSRTLTYMPGYLADSLGYLDEAAEEIGKTVEIVPFDSSSQSLAALSAGQIDMDVQLAQNAARAQVQGQDLTVTAVLNDAGVGGLVVDPSISEPSELEGKTVGFTGQATAAYPLLLAALEEDGVDASKVDFLTINDQSTFQSALANGEVDAILPGEPVLSQTVADAAGEVMYDFFDRDFVERIMGGSYASVTLMTNASFADADPDGVRAVTQAFEKAVDWMKDHESDPQAVLDELPEDYASLEPIFPDLYARIVQALPQSLAADPAAFETLVQIDEEQGAIDPGTEIDIDALYDNSYLR